MPVPVLVLDFDGTLTDAEEEGRPFVEGYLADIAALVGRPADDAEIAAIVARTEAELRAAPEDHPVVWSGRAVAPASVDPYLRMMPIAHRVLDHFGALTDHAARERLLGGELYEKHYPLTLARPVFRPGAAEVLAALAGTPTWVVTNSEGRSVASKIAALERIHGGVAWLAGRVRGGARKFEVDDRWEGVPASLDVPGLARPVLLRRRNYHDLIVAVLAEAGASFADLLVVGDIFELDLALPLALGARVALVLTPATPAYERAFLEAHPRGYVLRALSEIPALLAAGPANVLP